MDRRATAGARRRPPRQSQDHPPGQEADPRRGHPAPRLTPPTMLAKADITTLERSGHLYFVLTPRPAICRAPPDPAVTLRSLKYGDDARAAVGELDRA